jgi:hypothetical protein
VFVARDLTLLLDTAVDADRCRRLAGLGRRAGLEHAARRSRIRWRGAVRRVGSGGPQKLEADPLGDEDRARLRECFREARELLREAGVPVREDADAEESYVAQRRVWERVLQRCAERVGEDWEEVRGGP